MENLYPLRCEKLSIGIKTGIAKQTAEGKVFFDGQEIEKVIIKR